MATRGYTLIEIVVAVALFTIVMATPSGFFTQAILGQQKALSTQELLDNIGFTLEYISRALRMARKDTEGTCIAQNLNYESTHEGRGIEFKNYQGICQEFFWDIDDNRLKESKDGGLPIPLTSTSLEILSFKIGPTDSWSQDDQEQPRVTLFLKIKGKGEKAELQPEMTIQTTISQRNLDVAY